jgi:hypothetical protein
MINTSQDGESLAETQIDRFQNLLSSLTQVEGEVEIEIIDAVANQQEFFSIITNRQYHILQIIGSGISIGEHRQALPFGRQVELPNASLQDLDPKYIIPGDKLAQLIRLNQDLRLLYLSGAQTELLAAEIAINIPAVVGMRSGMTSQSSQIFTEAMYRAIFFGQPLDVAITAGRQEIDLMNPGSREWGLPVCYMQTADGMLLAAPPESAEPAESVELIPKTPLSIDQPPEDPQRQRSWQKLVSRLEVYQRNLQALEEQKARYGERSPQLIDTEIEKLTATIAEIKDQMDAIG